MLNSPTSLSGPGRKRSAIILILLPQHGPVGWRALAFGTIFWYHEDMKRKHAKTLAAIFSRPTPGSIPWSDIESLLKALGADIQEREGSRIAVVLFGEVRVFHRPHPSPDTDKGAVASIRKWLEENGETP